MHHYYYDAENRLIQLDGTLGTCSTATACYTYFPDGERAEKNAAGVRVNYLYDAEGHQNTEVNSSLGWNRIEVYAADRHLATYSGGAAGTTYFDHADWLGTEHARTNVTGSLCETISSLPFGDGMSTSGICGDPSPMHFTGQERDTETNLDDFKARYMASSLGRFVSPDKSVDQHPRNPQSWDLYSYVRENPLALTDPSGDYVCSFLVQVADLCNSFQRVLDEAQVAANKLKDEFGPESSQYVDAQRAIDAYGTQGVDNGVTIDIGPTGGYPAMTSADNSHERNLLDLTGQNIVVTLAPGVLTSGDTNSTIMTVGHEGSHVADAEDWAQAGFTDAARPTADCRLNSRSCSGGSAVPVLFRLELPGTKEYLPDIRRTCVPIGSLCYGHSDHCKRRG
jgi:RHS repeat-associated protein